MNLALELQLCAIGPDGRAPSSKVPAGLGGAVLAELALAERIRVGDGRVEVVDPAPTGDPLLDDVLGALGDPDTIATTPVSRLVQGIGIQASPRVYERLRGEGLIELEPGGRNLIGLRKPDAMRPTTAGEEPRRRLRAALQGEVGPDARTVALIALASECDLLGNHLRRDERREAERRLAGLVESDAISEGVRTAIKGAQAAAASAIIAAQG